MLDAHTLNLVNQCSPSEDIIACGMPRTEDLHAAKKLGLKTLVNLCPPGESAYGEAPMAEAVGLRYVNIPIAGAQDLTREKAQALAAVVDDCANHPVMVHCASGNRVGALFALKAFHVGGCGVEAAIAEGRKAGLKALEPAVRQILARGV